MPFYFSFANNTTSFRGCVCDDGSTGIVASIVQWKNVRLTRGRSRDQDSLGVFFILHLWTMHGRMKQLSENLNILLFG